ncbi:MAG: EFR1 family ferrodoxin [Lachnospiraceae bacterium]|nr:EFR1 family ferrodoxin [Lachnospiraceae bacterium]
MLGVYFSGTGNSRYAVETFCNEYNKEIKVFSIEDNKVLEAVKQEDRMIFAYPVQYSTVPKLLRDFISDNKELWKDKKIFIIATMGLFSGDGAGILGRLFRKYGAEIIGGLHVKMPDSIGDEKLLKRPLEKNVELIRAAENKIKNAVGRLKNGNPTREGLNIWYRLAGFFGQRLYFGHKTKNFSDKLRIDKDKCVACGKCENLCPMKNIKVIDGMVVQNNQCTMCYRCINHCPKQAITLLGKVVVEQSTIEKYLGRKEP